MMRASANDLHCHNPLTLAEQKAVIALSMVPGVGPARVNQLVERFRSAQAVLAASAQELAMLPGIGMQTALSIVTFEADDLAERQIERADQVGAEMITQWDYRYPKLLREIYDPPTYLWVRGGIGTQDQNKRALAIVGTRRPTEYGRRVAQEFGALLARIGFTIVSGLAYGIDAAAQSAAVDAGGRSIAILGSGADRIYPSRHNRLAHQMLVHGAVVSEYPMGEKPDAPNFPRRNRIISGLSRGVLIVEAYEEGGALITARLAIEQDREVYAIPGPIHSRASGGTNALIRDSGAKLVQRVEDILDDLGYGQQSTEAARAEAAVSLDTLPSEERRLCEAMTSEPRHIDQICAASGLDPATALAYLLNLEFKGIVRQLAGKQFFLDRPIAQPA